MCLCVFSAPKWSIWDVHWITLAIVCIACYHHWKSSPHPPTPTPQPQRQGNWKCGAPIVCQCLVIFVGLRCKHAPFPPPPGRYETSSWWLFWCAECILHAGWAFRSAQANMRHYQGKRSHYTSSTKTGAAPPQVHLKLFESIWRRVHQHAQSQLHPFSLWGGVDAE